jgi:hypothetical protein
MIISNPYTFLENQFRIQFLELIPEEIRLDVIKRLENPNHKGKGKTNNEIIQYVHNIFDNAEKNQISLNILNDTLISVISDLKSINIFRPAARQAISVIHNIFASILTTPVAKPNLPVEPLLQFSAADLMTFRAALMKTQQIKIDLGDEGTFIVWYNSQFSAINIQDVNSYNIFSQSGKLGIIIDDAGQMTSLQINNIAQTDLSITIPDQFLPRVHACFKKALEISSSYIVNSPNNEKPTVEITVVRRGIKEIPEFHLHELSQAIEKSIKKEENPKLKVSFLMDNLTLDQGLDVGGLSRDYLDDLMEGMVKSKSLSFKSLKGSLVLPHAKQNPDHLHSFSLLNQQETSLYRKIGKLMAYCYHSKIDAGYWKKTYLIGRHLDDSLFNAILCLTAQEIDTPFENLALATKLQMSRALLDAHTKAGIDLDFLKQRFDWLDQFNHLDDHKILEVAQHLIYADCLPEEFTINNEGDEPDMEKIRQNRAKLKKCLIDSIFLQKGEHGQFGAQLAPIHAMAQGMKSICHPGPMYQPNDNHYWDIQIQGINYQTFSTKVQGSLDRKEIAQHIQLDPSVQGSAQVEIMKKVQWLQEWILDEENGANEEELKNLLKFLTGSSSLPKNQHIHVTAQVFPYYPVPRVHTCSFGMELSPVPSNYGFVHNDHTKDNFIKSLKALALQDPSTYQMI